MADFNPDINPEFCGPAEEELVETATELYATLKTLVTGKAPVRRRDTIGDRVRETYDTDIDEDDPEYGMMLANYLASGRR